MYFYVFCFKKQKTVLKMGSQTGPSNSGFTWPTVGINVSGELSILNKKKKRKGNQNLNMNLRQLGSRGEIGK